MELKVKLTWRGMVLEGTVEEIEKIIHSIENTADNVQEIAEDSDSGEYPAAGRNEQKYVSTKFARHMLTRRDLSAEQLLVLKKLYHSDEPILATELQSLSLIHI